jgi:WD40 repeat protein
MSRILLASLIAISLSPALTQEKDKAKQATEDQAILPDKLDKLTLTLDPGGHTAVIQKVFFTPDSKQLITCGWDHCIRIWDVETGEAVKALYPPGVGPLQAVALSPDGKRLAVGSMYPEKGSTSHLIYLIALPEGRVERLLKGHTEMINALSFSGDGKRLASIGASRGTKFKKSADNMIRIWNLERDEPPQVLKLRTGGDTFFTLTLSPDGRRIAGLAKKNRGIILDLATGKEVATIQGSIEAGVVWSPDGKTLATGDANRLHLWDADGKPRSQINRHVLWIAFTKDSRSVLAGGYTKGGFSATLVDVATGTVGKDFRPKGLKFSDAHDGALSADGRYAATAGGKGGLDPDHAVFIWNMHDGTVHKRLAAKSWIGGKTPRAAWNASGDAVSWDESPQKPSFHLGDLKFGPHIPAKDVRAAVWKQNDLALERDGLNEVKVLKAGVEITRLRFLLSNLVTFAGKDRVVLASTRQAQFVLHDAHTGDVLRRFTGFGPGLTSIAPSPDGRFLLTISRDDQTLRIWSLDRDKPLLSLYVQGQDWIAWAPEGYYAATPGGEKLMGWTVDNGMSEMPTYHPVERFRKQFYRPDVIKLLLAKGNLKDALEAANLELKKQGIAVPEGQAELEKLLPPRAFLQILDKANLPRLKVRASAVATVPSQPVTALRLIVDGRPLPDGAGIKNFTPGVKQAEAEWTIDLPPGKHHLAVLARSPDVSSVSEPVEVEFLVKAQQPVMHVLAIGVSDYQDKTLKLDFAAKDAEDIANHFQKSCNGQLFREVKGQPLVNGQARRDTILKHLADLRKNVGPNDLVVVFFAGHGVKEKDKFYLLTVEAKTNDLAKTALSGEDLRKALGDVSSSCQVLLMLDACHSSAGVKNFRPAVDDITRNLTDDECGVAVFCAAMAHEKALEKSGNGLFTRAVGDALQSAKGHPRTGRLYLHHLHAYVFDRVSDESDDRQHPFLSLPWIVESFPVR